RPDHVPVRDLHIGVVSTDMGTGGYVVETCADPIDGDDGVLQHEPNTSLPGCESAYPTYLSYESDDPDLPAIDTMATNFGCIAVLGTAGCGFEQQLKAARRALVDHRMGPNAGFLRPNSLLAVLFVTDEEDCSVAPGEEEIFNSLNVELGHLNLRCFNHPHMVEPVETYVTTFRALKEDPDKLVLAFIVGVPQSSQCEGFGDSISTCLDHPDMIEQVDLLTMTRLIPSCVTSTGEAYPPRRFVQLAQQFGRNSIVQSICTSDFRPAIGVLTTRIQQSFANMEEPIEPVDVGTLPTDVCHCAADCRIVEELSDTRACETADKPCYRPDGTGTECALPIESPDGLRHTLCEIPQAGTAMTPCSASIPTECSNPAITHAPVGEGWFYMDEGWSDGSTTYPEPFIGFTPGMEPENGSTTYLVCCR
ncbi:MAG: hypothetical protein JRG91_11505, partial [Deltaproteobacteria bacterium]|nr:hypothetical protein [Deltaproteobacteria bacterium]